MNVEKKDGIWFKSDKHIYINDSGKRYISGTAFVGLFKQPFDSDFWSKYKAIEALLTESEKLDVFKELKLHFLKTDEKEIFNNIKTLQAFLGEKYIIVKEEFEEKVQRIQADWKKASDVSKEKGSAFHDKQEQKYREKYNHPDDFSGYNLKYPNLIADKFTSYPELRLYNHEYKIAGSADLVTVFKNGEFDIIDYKTSKTIKFESYKNPFTGKSQMMKEPISDIPDCNGAHYMLQISLYAWMLEQLGYKPRELAIEHVVFDGEDVIRKIHPVPYAKKAIELMLEHYAENRK